MSYKIDYDKLKRLAAFRELEKGLFDARDVIDDLPGLDLGFDLNEACAGYELAVDDFIGDLAPDEYNLLNERLRMEALFRASLFKEIKSVSYDAVVGASRAETNLVAARVDALLDVMADAMVEMKGIAMEMRFADETQALDERVGDAA